MYRRMLPALIREIAPVTVLEWVEAEELSMAKHTLAQKTAKQREAGRAVAKINNDALAFAERNREIVELPEGLETNRTMTRKRGARADDDVIQEAMERFAQGITLTASLRYVGLP